MNRKSFLKASTASVLGYSGMGEKYRDEVPLYADTGPVRDTPRYYDFIQQRLEKEYQYWKINIVRAKLRDIGGAEEAEVPTRKGLEIWGEDVYKVRNMIGYDLPLMADHFGLLTVPSAIEISKFFSDSRFGLAIIEDFFQPERNNSVNLHNSATEGSPIPTLFGENLFGLDGFMTFIDSNAVIILHPDMFTSGGMIETKKIADYADRFGIKMMIHATASPVGQIAKLHCAATTPEFDEPMLMLEAEEKGLIGYNTLDIAGPWPWWHLDENLNYGYHIHGS